MNSVAFNFHVNSLAVYIQLVPAFGLALHHKYGMLVAGRTCVCYENDERMAY